MRQRINRAYAAALLVSYYRYGLSSGLPVSRG